MKYNTRRQERRDFEEEMEKQSNAWAVLKKYA
jgi:hypothetical protein